MEYIKGSERTLLRHVPMRLDALAGSAGYLPIVAQADSTETPSNQPSWSISRTFILALSTRMEEELRRVAFSSMSATLFHFQAGSKPAV